VSTPWIVAFVALWIFTLLLATILLGLLRRVMTVLEAAEARVTNALTAPRTEGAAPGTRIPAFEATMDGGRAVESTALLREGAVLVFMEAGCEPCKQLAAELEGVGERIDGVPLYVVVEGAPAAAELALPPSLSVLYQREGAVSRAFETRATPQAFAVDATATVVERMIPGTRKHLRELASRCKQASAS
jgi:AhpC/TSA family